MGRDYDAAVMSSGFCGFMLGTTANAVANMGALVERYGPAPKAYLVVPLVGAFGIDFVNALLITAAINIFRYGVQAPGPRLRAPGGTIKGSFRRSATIALLFVQRASPIHGDYQPRPKGFVNGQHQKFSRLGVHVVVRPEEPCTEPPLKQGLEDARYLATALFAQRRPSFADRRSSDRRSRRRAATIPVRGRRRPRATTRSPPSGYRSHVDLFFAAGFESGVGHPTPVGRQLRLALRGCAVRNGKRLSPRRHRQRPDVRSRGRGSSSDR